MNDQNEKLTKMLTALNIKMKKEDYELTGKALLKRTMQNWCVPNPQMYTYL